MHKTHKHIIHSLTGVIIGGGFLYLTLRNKPLRPIWESLVGVDLFWIFISFFCLLITFYIRALRWQVLLEESGSRKAGSKVFTALLLGYFTNSFTPKFGEVVRCLVLKRTTGAPLSISLGTVMAERLYDMIILIVGLLTILLMEVNRLQELIDSTLGGITHIYGYGYLISIPFILAIITGLFLLSMKSRNQITHRWIRQILEFLQKMFSTLGNGFKIRRRGRFIILTALIWISLAGLNLCYLKALPETHEFPALFAVIVLFIGSIGWALPSPGGIGTTHFFILQLFLAYDLDPNAGISFGLLSNGLIFIFTMILGLWALYRFEMEKIKGKIHSSSTNENKVESS